MSRSSPSYSNRVSEKIDIIYEIEMPFEGRDAKINLLDQEDEVEIVISQIPVPGGYHQNYQSQRGETERVKQHGVARWVLADAARVLDEYDWNVSSHKANSGNRYLSDVYFTCNREDVDDAVMDAKKFLTDLEEKVLHHSRRSDIDLREPPSEMLNSE